jgi:hypothetical protein
MTDTPALNRPQKNPPRVASAVAASVAMLSVALAGFYTVTVKDDEPTTTTTTMTSVAPSTTTVPTQYTVGEVGLVTINNEAGDVLSLSAATPNAGWIVSFVQQAAPNTIEVVFASMGSTVTFTATVVGGAISTAVTQVMVTTTTSKPVQTNPWKPTPTTVKPITTVKPTTTTTKPTTTTVSAVTTTVSAVTTTTAAPTTTRRERDDD